MVTIDVPGSRLSQDDHEVVVDYLKSLALTGLYAMRLPQHVTTVLSSLILLFFTSFTVVAEVGSSEIVQVKLSQLKPTQSVIAHAQVAYKLNRYRFEPKKRRDDICEASGRGTANSEAGELTCSGDSRKRKTTAMKTAVRGPGNALYLTDGHHTFSTFYEMPGGGADFEVEVVVTHDKSAMTADEFWAWMQQNQLTWLVDAQGQQITPEQLPANLGRESLANDDYRAAMYFLRDLVWRKPSPAVPFVEFYWGNYLRQQPMLQPPNDLDDMQSYQRWLSKLAGFIGGMSADVQLTPSATAAELGKFAAGKERGLDNLVCDSQRLGKLGYALLDHNSQVLQHCVPNRQPLPAIALPISEDPVTALVEISSGQQQKWQQSHEQPNWLEWEWQNGTPRWVQFLGYPANYGIIPHTLLKAEDGGDGDPLDVLVLGSPLTQGRLVSVRIIGIMTMLDSGEQDNKLIAVTPENPVFGDITDIAKLSDAFPAIPLILQTWFEHYKGSSGSITDVEFESREKALKYLHNARIDPS